MRNNRIYMLVNCEVRGSSHCWDFQSVTKLWERWSPGHIHIVQDASRDSYSNYTQCAIMNEMDGLHGFECNHECLNTFLLKWPWVQPHTHLWTMNPILSTKTWYSRCWTQRTPLAIRFFAPNAWDLQQHSGYWYSLWIWQQHTPFERALLSAGSTEMYSKLDGTRSGAYLSSHYLRNAFSGFPP